MQKLTSYIELAGGIQGLFLIIVLLAVPSRRNTANRILALLLLSMSGLLLWCAIHDAGQLVQWPDLMGWGPALLFTLGPLLYLYGQALTVPPFTWKNKYILHFIPCLVAVISFFPFYVKAFAEKQRIVLLHYQDHQHSTVADLLPGLHFLVYLIPVLTGFSSFRKKTPVSLPGIHSVQLQWLRQLLWGFTGMYGLFLIVYFLTHLHLAGNFFTIAQSAFIFVIGYQGLKEPAIFARNTSDPAATTGTAGVSDEKVKYEKSALPAYLLTHYADALDQLMREEKLYLDSDLNLTQLAGRLSLPAHHLSQLFSQQLHTTFYDYINQHRLEEVKRALRNPQKNHLTILALAFEAGFRSKSAFNEAFKKETGMTPSTYKKAGPNSPLQS
jgi:AraC-like DNA-binding protein